MRVCATERDQRVILLLVLLAQFMPPLVLFSVGPLAPLLREALGLSREQIGYVSALFSTSAALTAIPSGWWADRWGVRLPLVGVQVMSGLALTATAVLQTYQALCLMAALAGFAHGAVMVLTAKAIVAWFPRERRATAMGAKLLMVSGAGGVAGVSMPTLALWGGWHWPFLLVGGLMLVSALVDLLLYRDRPQEASAVRSLPDHPQGPRGGLPWHVWVLAAAGFFFGGAQFSFTTYLPSFLLEHSHIPLVLAAGLLAQAQLGAMVSRVPSGWVSDRWFPGNRPILLRGMGVLALGVVLALLWVPPGASLGWLSVLVVLYGASGLSWGGVYLTLGAELVDPGAVGLVSGLLSASMHVGNLVTAPLFGYVVDVTGSYTYAWGLLGLWWLLGLGTLAPVRAISMPHGLLSRPRSEPPTVDGRASHSRTTIPSPGGMR